MNTIITITIIIITLSSFYIKKIIILVTSVTITIIMITLITVFIINIVTTTIYTIVIAIAITIISIILRPLVPSISLLVLSLLSSLLLSPSLHYYIWYFYGHNHYDYYDFLIVHDSESKCRFLLIESKQFAYAFTRFLIFVYPICKGIVRIIQI